MATKIICPHSTMKMSRSYPKLDLSGVEIKELEIPLLKIADKLNMKIQYNPECNKCKEK